LLIFWTQTATIGVQGSKARGDSSLCPGANDLITSPPKAAFHLQGRLSAKAVSVLYAAKTTATEKYQIFIKNLLDGNGHN
jgi:hypothetical protein